MKKLLIISITCIFIVLPMFVSAQDYITKGHYMIGGGFGFGVTDHEDMNLPSYGKRILKQNQFSFSPYVGKFIKDYLLIGVRLNAGTHVHEISYHQGNNVSITLDKRNNYGLSFYLRKIWTINDKFGGFLQPNLGYIFSKHDYESKTIENTITSIERGSGNDSHSLTLGLQLGIYYFIGKRFSLETSLAGLGFNYSISNNYNFIDTNDVNHEQDFKRINFGFNFINTLSFNQLLTVNYYF